MPFVKGQSGNPGGRPAHQQRYMKSLVRLVKTADWQDIVRKAIEQAKRGDKTARQFLADYVLGKPVQGVDLTSLGNKMEINFKWVDDYDGNHNPDEEAT
jgi:hypothetical protein